jgi:hypothetical protein
MSRKRKLLVVLVMAALLSMCFNMTFPGALDVQEIQRFVFQGLTSVERLRHLKERELAASDKVISLDLLKVFIHVAERHNWTYFIESRGTLLGSVRHWGFIPWDDDVDIAVNETHREDVKRAFKGLEPNYTVLDRSYDPIMKLFSSKSYKCVRKSCKYKWPSVDLIFFHEDEYRIWSNHLAYSKFKHLKSDIFPLHLRPFEGLLVKAPKCSLAWFNTVYYNTDACVSHSVNHANMKIRPSIYIKCELLKDIYPFVFRRWIDGKMEERLKMGNKTLVVRFVDELEWTVTKPYSTIPIGA